MYRNWSIPENHFHSNSFEKEISHKQKIKAGADYAVTQMFFDNKNILILLTNAEMKILRYQ